MVLLQLSVKVARAAPARGVCPGWEVSIQGDPRPGWEGSDSGSGRQDARAGPADQRSLGRLHGEVRVGGVPREGQRQQKCGAGSPEGGGIGERAQGRARVRNRGGAEPGLDRGLRGKAMHARGPLPRQGALKGAVQGGLQAPGPGAQLALCPQALTAWVSWSGEEGGQSVCGAPKSGSP